MWRLSSRLLAVAVVGAVLPALLGSWTTWQHYRSDREQASEQVRLLAQSLAGEGGRIMGSSRKLLDVLATFPSIKANNPVHCNRVLGTLNRTVPEYAILAVADASGRVFCASQPIPADVNAAEFSWYKRARHSKDGFGVSDFSLGELTGKPVLQFSLRADSDHGDVVILAALELASLSSAFSGLDLPADARVNVIDRTGTILYRHPDPGTSIGRPYPDQSLLEAIAAQGTGVTDAVGIDGILRISAFQPLSKVHDTGITVTVGRSREFVLTPARQSLVLNLLGLALAVGIATAFSWFGAGAYVVSSIHRLADTAKAITAGNLKARAGGLKTAKEIRELAEDFDLMAETLALRKEELEHALERLETSTDLARIGIYDWDVVAGTIVWNKQHFLLFGYDPDTSEASFAAFQARIHPEDRASMEAALASARKTGEDYRAEYRIVLPSGDQRWVMGIGRFTYDNDGRPMRMRGVIMDVTDRRKAEDTVRRVQKMDALGQMTGGIAHDVNNILGIISGNLQLIAHRPTEENVAEGVRSSLKAAERGADLIRRLLAFSRRQPGNIAPCDLLEEILKVKPLLEKSIPKSVSIGVFVPPEVWPVRMEAAEFGDALLNLAINAAHAMPNGGRLHIEAGNTAIDGNGLLGGSDVSPGEYVVLAVSDDGTGIPHEIVDKVFEPFFTTKERAQGSGLGLSMVYGFARRCGGTARIYSEMGRGTTVRLYLPHATGASTGERPAVLMPVEAPPGRGETVLIVDDEPGILRVAEAYLRDIGYRTLIAERPPEALALLGEVGRVDVLFSDIIMPGVMTGIDLANRMRIIQPDLKILLTTGFADSAPAREDSGHNFQVVAKPYQLDDIARRIRKLLDGAGSIDHQ